MVTELFLLQGIIERGLLFALIVCGVYITSRIISFDDLSVEGSFGLGGALMARCMLAHLPLYISFPCALIGGALTGCATGLLHTKLKLNNLISGIVVTTALFSINLKLAGASNSLQGLHTIFDYVPHAFAPYKHIIFLTLIVVLCISLIGWFLNTEIGFLCRATGDNPQMVTNLGKNKDYFKILSLVLSNALTALAGALFVQYVGYFSIWANVGILIIALASLIIAESLGLSYFVLPLILGSCIYQMLISLTLELNFDPEWNKLITAALIVLLLAIKKQSRN